MDIKNLTVLGTSHISPESIKKVREIMENDTPDILCLELDKQRFLSIKSQKKTKIHLSDIRRFGIKGFFFMILVSWAEKKLGKWVGTTPGEEMLTGIREAEKKGVRIELVDQRIQNTLKKISKNITWVEKFRFVGDLLSAPFKKKKIPFDIKKVPDKHTIKTLTQQVKSRYPNAYKALIGDRNIYMARRIAKILKHNPNHKVFAIMGAGHEDEVIRMLKNRFE